MNKRTNAAASVLVAVSFMAPIVAPLLVPTAALAATNTVVTPSNLQGWYLYNDQNDTVVTDTADHGFVTGPATPPAGTGSVHLTKTTNDSYGIATTQFASTTLASITALSYSTYRASGTATQAASLGFDIDSDTTDADTSYQGRLTYEPYLTQTVNTGAWQTWNALDDAAGTGTGNWWFSHATLSGGAASACTQANPCTWTELLAAYPHAAMRNPGQLILRTNGATGEVFDGNVDNLTVGVSGTNTTFDFDPTPAAPSTVKVTIDKYVDGTMATASNSNSSSFPMTATWNAANIGAGSGAYTLGPTGSNSANPYEAVTTDMSSNASYSTSEDLSGPVVGADCTTGKPYMLAGYRTGDTIANAQTATLSTTTPSFTGMTSDKVVLVYNIQCIAAPVISTPTNGATLTSAAFTMVDWNDVSDNATPTTYIYQASNASTTNTNGSFTAPVYTSAPLTNSQINTTGTPPGTYYLHVQAVDAHGNTSPWSSTVKVIIDNNASSSMASSTVQIDKYLDGQHATPTNASSTSFLMNASWSDANIGSGSGTYTLNASSTIPYEASTIAFAPGANYSTSEVTGGASGVGTTCSTTQPYMLQGYTWGDTEAAALSATPTTTMPSFVTMNGNKYVIVWNKTCSLTNGTIGGTVTGTSTGVLAVTSVTPVKTDATADNTYANGWSYIFNITVPTNERNLSMKFSDWFSSTTASTIPAGGNMQISSSQATASTTPVTITAANVYSTPPLTMTGDMDSATPGLQVQVLVQVKIPVNTVSASYTTNYGVQTLP